MHRRCPFCRSKISYKAALGAINNPKAFREQKPSSLSCSACKERISSDDFSARYYFAFIFMLSHTTIYVLFADILPNLIDWHFNKWEFLMAGLIFSLANLYWAFPLKKIK
jgi:hypothetical protein